MVWTWKVFWRHLRIFVVQAENFSAMARPESTFSATSISPTADFWSKNALFAHIIVSGSGHPHYPSENFFWKTLATHLAKSKKILGGVPGNSFFDQLNFGNSKQFANILAFVGCLLPFFECCFGAYNVSLDASKVSFCTPEASEILIQPWLYLHQQKTLPWREHKCGDICTASKAKMQKIVCFRRFFKRGLGHQRSFVDAIECLIWLLLVF